MTPGPVDPARHTFRSPKFASVVQEAVQFLSSTPVHPFTSLPSFPGVGVYALYYFGSFDLYDYLTALNQKEHVQPIYVGKAVPRGWRKARTSFSEVNRELFGRLVEHAHSIEDANNLEIEDFCCRFMILSDVESDLIAAVEAALIRQYRPLWNTVVDGFGNHDPGSGRYNQARSEWDILHPGRPWAENLTGTSPTRQSVVAKIQQVKSRLPLP
ncbi:MAG: Eco29kI family restriction endonuclease [Candidatus Latescibacteria bacterium]|nr:Eco29kI family restriction endonuclease [Candidatus Latescibacterota bacterium]